MRYIDLYNKYVDKLREGGFEEADSDVLLLIYEVFALDYAGWIMCKFEDIDEADKRIARLCNYIDLRLKHCPVQYIVNKAYFCGFPFYVDENVLIPRFDTEILVEEVLKLSGGNKSLRILDMCTGSGAVAIALSKLGGFYHIDALDISDKALEIAKKNAEALDCNINFFKSDMFSGLTYENKYDIIVSNPPYICRHEIETLDIQVKDFEPHLALDGDADGMKFYNIIGENLEKYVNKGGMLALEIGYDQADRIREIFAGCNVVIKKDLSGLDRVAEIYTY